METSKPKRRSPRRVSRGVMFSEDVLGYLEHLERHIGASRSHLVNDIIRQHAISSGNAQPVANLESIGAPVIRM